MNRSYSLVFAAAALAGLCGCRCGDAEGMPAGSFGVYRISVDKYVDSMKAGWIGQMAGVGWGGPTEFKYKGVIVPEDQVPSWEPQMINQFRQDDLYVEMTFLRTMELYGLGVSARQAGIDFANSEYPLWHANRAGRDNLRAGIAPPDSGHPKYNKHADDIDYQIEADYAGLIAPGMPDIVIQLSETFGRLMNYGDGLYGGQFIGGMYAAAFFEHDRVKIVEAGLRCIPKDSQYYRCISDVLKCYRHFPKDWIKTWELINGKYQLRPEYRRFSCRGPDSDYNIDAKINGAYVVMGLLYGGGDPDQTILIATRCGQDSDCNPSSAAGILFTTIGYEKLPDKFKTGLDPTGKFSHTPYDFPTLIDVSEKLAREAVVAFGGRIASSERGGEYFVIPRYRPQPLPLEQSWDPNLPAESRYTEEEMAKITAPSGKDLSQAVKRFAPGWQVNRCGDAENPGLRQELRGRENVLVTSPLSENVGCVLSRNVRLPANHESKLKLVVGHDARGDWDLVVEANGKELLRKTVGQKTTSLGWTEVDLDLSQFAGQTVNLELVNEPTGWHYEDAYWAEITLVTQ
jgi:hypothetical protein